MDEAYYKQKLVKLEFELAHLQAKIARQEEEIAYLKPPPPTESFSDWEARLEAKARGCAIEKLKELNYAYSPETHNLEVQETTYSWVFYFSVNRPRVRGGDCEVIVDKHNCEIIRLVFGK